MDVSKIYAKVEEAVRRKNFDFAIEMLKNQILKFNPNDVKARKLLRATVLQKCQTNGFPSKVDAFIKGMVPRIKMVVGKLFKKWDMVVDEAENYLQHDPKNLSVLYSLGEGCREAGYTDTAIAVFETLLSFNQSHLKTVKALGKIYLDKNELEKANQYFHRAQKMAPQDIESAKMVKDLAAQITAQTYANAASSQDLIRDKDKAKELQEDASTLRTEEDILKAIERAKKKVQEDPNNRKELRKLGDLYQKVANFDEAVANLNKLLQLDPSNFDVQCRIGDCKIAQIEQQVEAMKENLKKNPQNPNFKQKLQELLKSRNDLQIQEYDLRVKQQPLNYELRFKFGVALFQARRFDEAIGNFQQAIQDPRNKIASYNYMGQAFSQKQEYELAVEQYQSALGLLTPKDQLYREITYNLGLACEFAKDYDKAIEKLTELMKLDIGYKDVQARIKKLREMKGA